MRRIARRAQGARTPTLLTENQMCCQLTPASRGTGDPGTVTFRVTRDHDSRVGVTWSAVQRFRSSAASAVPCHRYVLPVGIEPTSSGTSHRRSST